MEQRTIERLGRSVSVVGLGTWQLGADWGEVDPAAARGVLEDAFEAGVTATLAEFKPKGPPPIKRCEWSLRGGDPATIGRTAALMARRET